MLDKEDLMGIVERGIRSTMHFSRERERDLASILMQVLGFSPCRTFDRKSNKANRSYYDRNTARDLVIPRYSHCILELSLYGPL